jgi:hypothetical protein
LHQLSQFNFRLESLPKDKIDADCFNLKATKALFEKMTLKIPKKLNHTPSTP